MPKLLIADDHAISAAGTMHLLWEAWPDIVLANTIDGAIRQLDRRRTDLLILDLDFKEVARSGCTILRHCVEHHPLTRVLVLTAFDDHAVASSVKQQGAHGCLGKHAAPAQLVQAARAVLEGGEWWGTLLRKPLLTPRQGLILQYLARGFTHKAMAERLRCAEVTVEAHAREVRERLGVTTTVEAIRRAEQIGLLIPGISEHTPQASSPATGGAPLDSTA